MQSISCRTIQYLMYWHRMREKQVATVNSFAPANIIVTVSENEVFN